jgi:hypothetical protein
MKKERYTIASQMRDLTKARVQMIHGITENHSILTETEQCKILATNIIELVNKKSSRDDFIRDILFFIKVVPFFHKGSCRIGSGRYPSAGRRRFSIL